MDSNGHVHQFTYTGSGDNTWHWAGSTADKGNPLQLQNDQKSALRKLGWTSKQGILK